LKRYLDPLMENSEANAFLLIIGNEILTGRTKDANTQFLGKKLGEIGISVCESRILPDDEKKIINTIRQNKDQFDYIFTTGGIGPTHDDITAKAVAKALNIEFERNAEAEELLRNFYSRDDITEARLSMADMPKGATLLENPISKAPGFKIENVFVLPGIPKIVERMFEGLRHHLTESSPFLSKTIVSSLPEGIIGGRLAEIQAQYENTEIGSYPFSKDGKIGVNIVIRSKNVENIKPVAIAIQNMIRKLELH